MSDIHSKKRSKKDKKHDSVCAEAVEGKIKDKVLVEEKRLSQMSVKELGELLASQGLSKTGKKAELVARLITGVPDVTPPSHDEVSYDWDPTSPSKKKFTFEKAKSGKGNCIRCLTSVAQGCQRTGFDSWDVQSGHKLTRWYHLECFAKFPCKDLTNINSIKFEEDTPEDLKQLFEAKFAHYATTGSHNEPRETPITMQGLRDQTIEIRNTLGVSKVDAVAIVNANRGEKRCFDGNYDGEIVVISDSDDGVDDFSMKQDECLDGASLSLAEVMMKWAAGAVVGNGNGHDSKGIGVLKSKASGGEK